MRAQLRTTWSPPDGSHHAVPAASTAEASLAPYAIHALTFRRARRAGKGQAEAAIAEYRRLNSPTVESEPTFANAVHQLDAGDRDRCVPRFQCNNAIVYYSISSKPLRSNQDLREIILAPVKLTLGRRVRARDATRSNTHKKEIHMTARVEPYSDAFDELAELEFTPRLERLGLGVDIERGLLALLRSAYMAGAVAAIAAYNSNLELMRLQNSR